MKTHSICTLGLALALATQGPGFAQAASHCKGLAEAICGTTAACRWNAERPGAMNKSPRKAHCRLDVGAAAKIAAKIAGETQTK